MDFGFVLRLCCLTSYRSLYPGVYSYLYLMGSSMWFKWIVGLSVIGYFSVFILFGFSFNTVCIASGIGWVPLLLSGVCE